MVRRCIIVLAGLLGAHCSSAEEGDGCAPNMQDACVTSSGDPGIRVCDAAGRFGACEATGSANGGSTNGGSSGDSGSSGTSASGGSDAVPSGDAELRAQLADRAFEWESFDTSANSSDQVFNQLVLCESGVFGLIQQTNTFFPGSGSIQGEDQYTGTWSLATVAGGDVLVLTVTGSTDEDVASPLEFGVASAGGEITFDDNYNLPNATVATVTDASAECAGVEPGGDGPTPAPSSGACEGIPDPESACDECLVSSCCAELQTCIDSAPCLAVLACIEVCPDLDDACVQSACDPSVEAGVDDAARLLDCNAGACADTCG